MKKKQWKKWGLGILILLLFSLFGVAVGLGISFITSPSPSQNPGGVQLDPNQGDYVNPNSGNHAQSQGVAIPGWGTITIPVNQTEVTVDFYNPKQNEGLYYLTFEFRLPDGNGGYEVLYRSGLIEAGKHIQKITLTHGLKAGIYDAIIFVQPYRMDGITPTNNAETQTRLIVK